MPDEATRKHMALEYARRFNAGDIDGVLELFADDIVFEDPVGHPPAIGKEALRRHLEGAIEYQAYELPGSPVTSMDDRFVVTPTKITLRTPTPMTFNVVGIVEVDEEGLGRHVRAFWGVTDMSIGETPEHVAAEPAIAQRTAARRATAEHAEAMTNGRLS